MRAEVRLAEEQNYFEPAVCEAVETLSSMAEYLKREQGDFLPFGVLVFKNGEVATFTIETGEEESECQNFLPQLLESLREELTSGEHTHAGVCMDMTTTDEDGAKQDVFGFYVESHTKHTSFLMQPYLFVDGKLEVGECIQTEGPPMQSLF